MMTDIASFPTRFFLGAGCALAGLAPLAAPAAETPVAPSFHWQTASPRSEGFSKAKLDALCADLAIRHTKAFLVARDDRIVYEWYAPDWNAAKPHYTASMAKAVIGGVALAAAMDRTSIRLDDLASKYIAAWRSDPVKSTITVRELGSHTSGLGDADVDADVNVVKLTGWMGEFWHVLPPPRDPFTIARDIVPMVAKPGAEFHYSNPGIGMMCYCITAALRDSNSPQKDIRSLLRDAVMRRIGIADDQWDCGYDKTSRVDGLPLVGAWGGADFTARAAARLGRLMLHDGDWDGDQVLSAEAVRKTTADSGLPNAVNAGWWTNARGRVLALPRDAYWASGAGNQTLLIVPSLKLIMVRFGDGLAPEFNDPRLFRYLLAPLARTMIHPPTPFPES
ncbi:MAG: serine hydrolase domain-containing protein [Opitutaceae bacterium]